MSDHYTSSLQVRTQPGQLDVQKTPNTEEWTTSRKVVNHKTKQVETRVQRQIIMEDGKVIADSGPQVTTRTKQDHKKEESENSNHKTSGDPHAPPGRDHMAAGTQVVDEKTETHQSMREAKEENMHYHDESFKELSGHDIHMKALRAPNELIKLDSDDSPSDKPPKGKLMHYSAKSRKINDTEEVKEVSKLDREGKFTTETTRTQHHEEFDDDEVPESSADANALPDAANETTRKIEYLKDYDEGFDNFQNVMNRRNNNVRHSSDRRIYSSNEDVRNKTSSSWLDDHFGSDDSDIVEVSPPRAGRVVNVDVHRNGTSLSASHSDRSRREKSTYTRDSPQKYTSTATYYVKEPRSPSPRNEYYISRSVRDSRYKEDASIQASLSDEDDNRVNDFKSVERKQTKTTSSSRSDTPSSRPDKSFYFGDDSHRRQYERHDDLNNKNNTNSSDRDIYQSVNRDYDQNHNYQVNAAKGDRDWRGNRYNDKANNDFDTYESLRRTHYDNTDNASNTTWTNRSQRPKVDDPYYGSAKPREYIHRPIIEDNYYSSRRDPSTRQRSNDVSLSPPPLFASETSQYSRNQDYKYNYTLSGSPPSSGGTWTKSKGRDASSYYRSNDYDMPEFSPLSSHLQIKSLTDSISHSRKYSPL